MLNTYNGPDVEALMRGQRNLNRLAYFTAVVEKGSFTAASDALGITKAVISQQVAKLEEEIGTALLIRTTRRVQPTGPGKDFYSRCLSILTEAESAFEQVSAASSKPTGILRITAPLDFGITVVTPAAAAFRRAYPDCDVSLMLLDPIVDLVAEQIDLSIRVGWLADSSLKARKIGEFGQLTVCLPQIAATLKRGAAPDALSNLPFIANPV
jgi:DNA-binding transcriptional LysR family regulator